MPHRVSPTDRIRGHIDELFAQHKTLPEILEDVARLGAQLLMQAALEAEITEFLGRDRYQRAARPVGRIPPLPDSRRSGGYSLVAGTNGDHLG
jgi:putative transposase